MSPVKISAIKTHIPAISRISASTINVNNYIEKRSLSGVSRNFSDETDDDEQIIAVPGWEDDSEEEKAQSAPQSDNEDENSQREPTQYDSDSETEEASPQPKHKQVRGIKGESSEKSPKTAKNTEKSTKKPSNKKESKDSDEKPKNNRSKSTKKDEKPAASKGKQKKPAVEEEHISETTKTIAFESDNEDTPVAPQVTEKPQETPKNRAKSPGKQKKLEAVDKAPMRQQQLPDLVGKKSGKKSGKKRTNKRELTNAIDNDVFTAYREAIAPFFETIRRDGKEVSPEDRFEEMDAFYASVEKLASKMEKELGDNYSKHNLQIKKIDKKQTELQYVDGEKVVKAKSPINGQDILKFFRMNPMKKELEQSDVEAFLMGPFIDTVNVLAIDTKQLSLLDYDRLTLFSYFNDINYLKPSMIEYNMPAYIRLISKINKWSFSGVFEARSNWLCVIPDTDKERMWDEAVRSFDAFKAEDNDVSENVLNIWDNLIHSQYVKQFIMYCANPSPLFGKIFKMFLETTEYKDDMMILFEGPLEPIASMFTPLHFYYRGVQYGNSEEDPTFSDMVKVINDPSMYDPRYNAWIARIAK